MTDLTIWDFPPDYTPLQIRDAVRAMNDIKASLGNRDMYDAHRLYDAALTLASLASCFSPAALRAVSDKLAEEAQRANIVVVNLVAASVPSPAALARALYRPGAMLSGPDKALLLVGADDRLLGELTRIGGEIATMPTPA